MVALRVEGLYDRKYLVAIRDQEREVTMEMWTTYLASPGLAGNRTISAVLPCLDAWMARRTGGLTFCLTQLLSGHGCFGSYLFRIKRAASPVCEACNLGEIDTPEHTLMVCVRWQAERERLIRTIGRAPSGARTGRRRLTPAPRGESEVIEDDPILAIGPLIVPAAGDDDEGMDPDLPDPVQRTADISLEHLVKEMVSSREVWIAAAEFAEIVMATKEEEERERQRRALSAPPPPAVPPAQRMFRQDSPSPVGRGGRRRRRRRRPPRISDDDSDGSGNVDGNGG